MAGHVLPARTFTIVIVSFDTNILVYAADRRELKKQDRAIELLRNGEPAVLLWQVCCEFIAASRKLGAQGLTSEEAWDQLLYYRAAFPLVLPAPVVLDHARDLHLHGQLSFWDAMILAACREAGVTRLYSEDLADGPAVDRLDIINPFKS